MSDKQPITPVTFYWYRVPLVLLSKTQASFSDGEVYFQLPVEVWTQMNRPGFVKFQAEEIVNA